MTWSFRENKREDLGILSNIKLHLGKEKALSVAAALDALSLPIPRAHEYFVTADFGYLVLMNPLGCAMRMTSNKIHPPIKHPRIVQPLKTISLDEDHRIDVLPGLKLVDSTRVLNKLDKILARDHICLVDNETRNCALVPRKALKSIFNYAVVCDLGACEDQRVEDDKNAPTITELEENEQEKAYGHLREAFTSGDMTAAWKLCADNKTQGILRSDWEKPPLILPRPILEAARNYEPRIAHLARE